jgi:excinuclease UvrABC ATPase subunit
MAAARRTWISSYLNDRGDIVKRAHPFEGIVPNLERRYRETESASVREELAKFLSTQSCPDCRGTRLRREARHVWVGEKTLPAVTNLPIGDACEYFGVLKPDRATWRNCRQDPQGNSRAPAVPGQCGVGLPVPGP